MAFTCADEMIATRVGTEGQDKEDAEPDCKAHPTLEERIERALQYGNPGHEVNITDAWALVPGALVDRLGTAWQKCMAEGMRLPDPWEGRTAMDMRECPAWVEDALKEYSSTPLP